MSKPFVKDFGIDEFTSTITDIDLAAPGSQITKKEKEYSIGTSKEEAPETYMIFKGYGIFVADADKDVIRMYSRSGKIKRAQKPESTEDKTRTLEGEIKLLRELLTDKSSGVGLMRISLICSVTFFLFHLIGAYTPLILVHPAISILGFIGSLGFFCIGWINSKS